MREAILLPRAREYRDRMSDAEQRAIVRRIDRLERDASVDGRTTLDIPDIPTLFIYDDGEWRMSYAIPDEVALIIRSIAHALDLPD